VRAAACARPRAAASRAGASVERAAPIRTLDGTLSSSNKVVAIGASTGGTEALVSVLGALPADTPPVLVVQHMPARFLVSFAERLDKLCRMQVKLAGNGDKLQPGCVLVGPGGTHLQLARVGNDLQTRLTAEPAAEFHKPAVEVLFNSCAKVVGKNATAVMLTGMGADGAGGMLQMRRAGAHTIAQNEETCVVFGMPKEAIARGGVVEVLPLERIAQAIVRSARS
jgi:two-component system chemotaxis response regulator CheB